MGVGGDVEGEAMGVAMAETARQFHRRGMLEAAARVGPKDLSD